MFGEMHMKPFHTHSISNKLEVWHYWEVVTLWQMQSLKSAGKDRNKKIWKIINIM